MKIKGYEIDPDMAKMFYNWFHIAYPEWQTNGVCQTEEIRAMQDLEEFILKSDKIQND